MKQLKGFIDLKQLLDLLRVSSTTYYNMRKPHHNKYDPDLPAPADPYGDAKLRFLEEEVEAYIEKLKDRARDNKLAA